MASQRKTKPGVSEPARRAGQPTGFRRAEVIEQDTYLVRDKVPAPPANAGSGNAVS